MVLQTAENTVIKVEVAALSQADQNHLKTLSGAAVSQASENTAPAPAQAPVQSLPLPSGAASSPRRSESGSANSVSATPRAADSRAERRIPRDPTIDKIPLLKRKSLQQITFSFYDLVRGKTVTSNEMKDKFVYVHAVHFYDGMGAQLQQLKLLHDKYAKHGFEIISIHPYANRNVPGVNESYEDAAMRRMIRRFIEDYGITWYIAYPAKPGSNPLLSKFADTTYFDWLLDDQMRLIHANISTTGSVYTSPEMPVERLGLGRALEMIFPGVK